MLSATTEIYTLSLHDALPISIATAGCSSARATSFSRQSGKSLSSAATTLQYLLSGETCRTAIRSEEHTSELQSHSDLVCRLLLEKKKDKTEIARDETPRPRDW